MISTIRFKLPLTSCLEAHLNSLIINTGIALIALVFITFNATANEASDGQIQVVVNTAVEDKVALKTSVIKGNKELPQVLYIVPWQEIKKTTQKPENMVLHSLYGDIFQPITAADIAK